MLSTPRPKLASELASGWASGEVGHDDGGDGSGSAGGAASVATGAKVMRRATLRVTGRDEEEAAAAVAAAAAAANSSAEALAERQRLVHAALRAVDAKTASVRAMEMRLEEQRNMVQRVERLAELLAAAGAATGSGGSGDDGNIGRGSESDNKGSAMLMTGGGFGAALPGSAGAAPLPSSAPRLMPAVPATSSGNISSRVNDGTRSRGAVAASSSSSSSSSSAAAMPLGATAVPMRVRRDTWWGKPNLHWLNFASMPPNAPAHTPERQPRE